LKADGAQVDQDKLMENNLLATGMLQGYAQYAEKTDDFDEVTEVEQEHVLRIKGTRVDLVCRWDMVVKRQGGLWLVDHKTCDRFTDESMIEMDDQFTAYLWFAREMKRRYGYGTVRGLLVNMLRKKIPEPIPLLKDGSPSRNKSLECTPEDYLQAIIESGKDPNDYEDMLNILSLRRYYDRVPAMRSERTLDIFGERLTYELREMSSTKSFPYPTYSFMCARDCQYLPLCRCVDEGGDLQFLIDHTYLYEKERH